MGPHRRLASDGHVEREAPLSVGDADGLGVDGEKLGDDGRGRGAGGLGFLRSGRDERRGRRGRV